MSAALSPWWRWRKRARPVVAPIIARDADATMGWVALLRGAATIVLAFGFAGVAPAHGAARWGLAGCLTVIVVVLAVGPARWLAAPWVRAGRVRGAFRVMRLTELAAERHASAVAVAALAAARQKDSSAREVEFLEAELRRAQPRASRGVLAHALVRALAGDDRTARALFAMIDASPPRVFDRLTRRAASVWLAADDARSGEFARMARRTRSASGRSRRAPASVELLAAVARRLVGDPDAPSDTRLRLRAWLAPAGRALRPLVERALGESRRAAEPTAAPAHSDADLLGRALAAQREWLLAPGTAPFGHRLLTAARAWDAVSAALGAGQGARLGGDDAASPEDLEALFAAVASDLATSSVARGVPLHPWRDESHTLALAYDSVCEALFEEIDTHLDHLVRRVEERRERPVLEEWVEWAVLRAMLVRAHHLGGARVRFGAFGKVHANLTKYAAWLYNQRRLHLVAHAIFSWLLAEAEWAKDDGAIELCARNVRCHPA